MIFGGFFWQYTKNAQKEKRQWKQASNFHQVNLCRKVMVAWKGLTQQGRQFKLVAEEKYSQKATACKR